MAQRLGSCVTVIGTDRAALDLSKLHLIPQALDKIGPELVINAAAYTAVDRSEQEPALATAAGAYRDRRLAQATAGELAVTVDHADLLVLP